MNIVNVHRAGARPCDATMSAIYSRAVRSG